MQKILAEDFTVRIVPDLFVNIHDRSEIIKVNYKILLQSLFVINESYKEQIIIFDRTPFDNFMYYIMREMEKSILCMIEIRKIVFLWSMVI